MVVPPAHGPDCCSVPQLAPPWTQFWMKPLVSHRAPLVPPPTFAPPVPWADVPPVLPGSVLWSSSDEPHAARTSGAHNKISAEKPTFSVIIRLLVLSPRGPAAAAPRSMPGVAPLDPRRSASE